MLRGWRMSRSWPEIPYDAWRETCSALHLYTQIVGKYRLARTPWVNHSWHATLYVDARGLTTSAVPDAPGSVEIVLDLLDHAVIGRRATADGQVRARADVGRRFPRAVHRAPHRALGATPEFHGRPSELPDPVPFAEDQRNGPMTRTRSTASFRRASRSTGC